MARDRPQRAAHDEPTRDLLSFKRAGGAGTTDAAGDRAARGVRDRAGAIATGMTTIDRAGGTVGVIATGAIATRIEESQRRPEPQPNLGS